MTRLSLLFSNATDAAIDCAVMLDALDPLCACGEPADDSGRCGACRLDAERDEMFWAAYLVVKQAIARVNAGQVARYREHATQPVGRAWA